jgi:hypothetical protein
MGRAGDLDLKLGGMIREMYRLPEVHMNAG